MTFPNLLCCFIGLTICFQDIFASSFKSFDDFFCKTKVGTCEANEKLILEGRPPVCYCDVVCVIFNDCCHDFTTNTRNDLGKDKNTSQVTDFPSNHNLNRTHNGEEYIRFESPRSQDENASKARNNITQYVALTKMDTCLRVDDDVSGFWVVNTCLDKRKRCSESMRMRDVLRHLPVTDHQNVTYFGEECAKCNNVTNFTTWGIMASSYTLSDDLKVLSLLEGIDTGNLQSTLEKIGPIQLIAPPMSPCRVCHRFSTKDKNIIPTGCPHYQCTTTSELRGDVKGIFRNPECCISSGRCFDLVSPGWTTIKGVAAIHPWDEIGWLGSMKFRAYILPGSMQKPCDASLNERGCMENCTNDKDSSCIPSKVGVCNYPLRDRFLTLALEGHYDARLTRLVMRMISTYLWKSIWFLHDSRFTHVYNSKNGQYKTEDRVCTNFSACVNKESYFTRSSNIRVVDGENVISFEHKHAVVPHGCFWSFVS